MPIYNSARYLPAAIESVLSQSLRDFELLIIDDCSSDGSSEIAADYAARDKRIRFLRNEPNKGMVANWNYCLELARGEYIKFLFGDDLLSSPDNLSLLAGLLDADRSVSLAGSSRWNVDEHCRPIKMMEHFGRSRTIPGRTAIRLCLEAQKNLFGEPSVVMFRKSQACRGFDPRYRQLVDQEMWFHLLSHGDFAYVQQPLASFRIHADQQTKVNARDLVHLDEMQHLYADYLPHSDVGMIGRLYLAFRQHYVIWKIYREPGAPGLAKAREKIGRYIPLARFYLLLPVYKLFTPIWKVTHELGKRRQ